MTLSEFKAWFEGFTESMEGPPSAKAWKRIQARVKEISGQPVTERVYIDRYVEPYRRWFYSANAVPLSYSAGACTAQNGVGNAVLAAASGSFDSHTAMADLGRNEAQALLAS